MFFALDILIFIGLPAYSYTLLFMSSIYGNLLDMYCDSLQCLLLSSDFLNTDQANRVLSYRSYQAN